MTICPLHRAKLGLGWEEGQLQDVEFHLHSTIRGKRRESGRKGKEESGKTNLKRS